MRYQRGLGGVASHEDAEGDTGEAKLVHQFGPVAFKHFRNVPAENLIAETGRLVIRPLIKSDVPALATIWTDPRVTRFMGGPREFAKIVDSLSESLAAPPERFDLWAVVAQDTGTVIGHCGLLPKEVGDRDETELIYVITADHWGRGYATEAAAAIRDFGFKSLGIQRLVSLIDPNNAASERVAIKVGLKHEADTVRPNGRTMKVYSITRA